MDPTAAAAAAAAPTGLVGWILANGQIVLFIAQLLFWLVLGVAAIWAAIVFDRYVKFVMHRDGELEDETPATEEQVSIEEFVE
jgi:hypothetical protein